MIDIITGDLLQATEKFIAHQCNCLSSNSSGIDKLIFDRFPHANTYAKRINGETGKPGTIDILGNGSDQRQVINMYAQYYPGKSKYPNSIFDGIVARNNYFYRCLLRIAKIPSLESVAFPWRIGCNLGGGNWEHYLGNLTNFEKHVSGNGVKVSIYRLPEN